MTATLDYEEQVQFEARRLQDIAANSKNLGVISLAVAASDPVVQQVLLGKLRDGHVLVGTSCVTRSIGTERGVVFLLERPENRFSLIEPSFCATVNLESRTVTAIDNPFVRESDDNIDPTLSPAGALPFVLVIPSGAPEVLVPEKDLAAVKEKRRAFLEVLRPGPIGPATAQTTFDSPFVTPTSTSENTTDATSTDSGTPPLPDDTKTDFFVDDKPDMQQDHETDQDV